MIPTPHDVNIKHKGIIHRLRLHQGRPDQYAHIHSQQNQLSSCVSFIPEDVARPTIPRLRNNTSKRPVDPHSS